MHVRRMERDDLADVVGLLADDDLGRRREDPDDLAPYRRALAAIDDDPNQVVVVLDDGEVVGTLQLTLLPNLTHRGAWRAQVEGVRIARHRRGEGLGHVLFDWAVDEARRRGCRLVQLTTDRSRPDAQRFYESLGFVASHVGMKLVLED